MRSKTLLILLFSLSLLLPNWLQAEPIQGVGLYLSVGIYKSLIPRQNKIMQNPMPTVAS